MSTLTDRLRGIVMPPAHGGARALPPHPASESDAGRDARTGEPSGLPEHDAAHVLRGEWCDAGAHRFLVVDRTYTPEHRHGRVAVADALPAGGDCWPELALLAGTPCGGRALFIDLETTGLAGGAGTYAFLVGCAWFDGRVFRIRQFFLSSFAAERVLLETVGALAGECGVVVTYNGKTFDLPLIETRFVLHRMQTPFAAMPHVDMLHPARRMWRPEAEADAGGCRLTHLEEALCGYVREGDVPGFEIPSRYFDFVRRGDARPLAAVLEHNRLDLLSLALVTARAAMLLDAGEAATRTAREALGLGRLFERGGRLDRAGACFARAAGLHPNPPHADAATRAEALRACAVLARRERRYAAAADAWQRLIALRPCPPHLAREAAEALAVHHEHRLRDPLTARGFAMHSLQLHDSTSRTRALQHRLARLDRKLGSPPAEPAPLF